MKLFTTVLTVAVAAASPCALAGEPTYRVVVALKDQGASEATLRMAAIDAAQRRVGRLLDGRRGRVSRAYVSVPALSAVVTREGWAALASEPDVARVDLDLPVGLAMATVGARVGAIEAQTLGLTGKGVTVAIIDTGVDASHPDLADAIVGEACFCMDVNGKPCCRDGTSRQIGPGTARDEHGHGTHMAGIIAGRGHIAPRGMAPDASVIAIRILDRDGRTSTSSMLAALDWLLTSKPEARVVNMSLGTIATYAGGCDADSAVTLAFAAAGRGLRARGAVLVTSSGNSGLANQMMAPGCVSGFNAVGAVYARDESAPTTLGCTDPAGRADQVACFSNSGSMLALLAPGVGILSSGLGGGLGIGSGTSQAAAVVAGATALLLEAAPRASAQIDDALRHAGPLVADPRNGRLTPRIDVRAALAALGSR